MEFVGLLRRVYTDAEHFDFEGQFHHSSTSSWR
jgi:hypothetical protein